MAGLRRYACETWTLSRKGPSPGDLETSCRFGGGVPGRRVIYEADVRRHAAKEPGLDECRGMLRSPPDWSGAGPFAPFPGFLSILSIFLETLRARGPFMIAMTARTCTTWIRRQTEMNSVEDGHSDLIQRACSDPNAFAELYLRHYQDVFRYCVRRLFDRHSAEDVTSTIFFKVMHNLGSFDGPPASFRNWLLRIATNAVNDHLRDVRRRSTLIQRLVGNRRPDATLTLNCDDDVGDRKALLKQALLSLRPAYQTVITLRFFENMKLTEIAACLGERPSTVSTRLSRATARLRKKLEAGRNSRG
jgi:RNA polymerase sigma-70 factor (ECF subfamily)